MSSKKRGASRRRTHKKPYRTPKLTVHGDIRVLTKAKGGTRNDSGRPKAKTVGAA